MNYKKPKKNWLIYVAFALIISLLWFFSDLKNTESIQIISDQELKIAEPLPNNITVSALDQFTNRLIISEGDLRSLQPYTPSE